MTTRAVMAAANRRVSKGPIRLTSTNPIDSTDPQNIGTTVEVRGERCAQDKTEARIYTINLTCGDSDTGSSSIPSTVDLNVTVPHDKQHAKKLTDQ
jgi:hypothetical protein